MGTLRQLNKAKLLELVSECLSNMEEIKAFSTQINTNQQKIIDAENKLLGEEGYVEKINKMLIDIKSKKGEIDLAYNAICIDTDEDESIKTIAENALEEINEQKDEVQSYYNSLFGYENEEGKKVIGIADNMKDFFTQQEEKYTKFFNKIEKELSSGVASANLAKTFSDKVIKYEDQTKKREATFIGVLLLAVIVSLITLVITPFSISMTTKDIINHLLYSLPIYLFGIWLIIFVGNRRAETNKLSEAYKHKEVLARSFVGYRTTIQEFSEENEEEISLLKSHMQTLLTAIGVDSSSFLNKEGDKHPLIDLASKIFTKKN